MLICLILCVVFVPLFIMTVHGILLHFFCGDIEEYLRKEKEKEKHNTFLDF